MTGKLLSGCLNRMRRNLDSLDESIENLRKAPRGEGADDKRARLKLLRDLIELQNASLLAVKTHLLGCDETGAPNEPADVYNSNDEVEFERYFKNQLVPWTGDDLKLECEDCGLKSEQVSYHAFRWRLQWCDSCRIQTRQRGGASRPLPASVTLN